MLRGEQSAEGLSPTRRSSASATVGGRKHARQCANQEPSRDQTRSIDSLDRVKA